MALLDGNDLRTVDLDGNGGIESNPDGYEVFVSVTSRVEFNAC
jgi:hypothetical protein